MNITKHELAILKKIVASHNGTAAWLKGSSNGKPNKEWKEKSKKGGLASAKARQFRKIKRLHAKTGKIKPPEDMTEYFREEVLKRWQNMKVQDIADALSLHPDTVRKYARNARKQGDPRAINKRPDLIK